MQLEEVVVTATRTERKLSTQSVPVQLISRAQILAAGSQRLNDILAEQPGLAIMGSGTTGASGGGAFGNGVQMQGLSPDYTLILLNGEPLIGRNGGVLDLSRVSVGNVQRIEIIKGPSSALYGSEAMGGVINIITTGNAMPHGAASLRVGRFGATDLSLNANARRGRLSGQAFLNRNASCGYDLDRALPGKTVDPFQNYTAQVSLAWQASARSRFSLGARGFYEDQKNYFVTSELGSSALLPITGQGRIHDLNLTPTWLLRISPTVSHALRGYYSRYQYEQQLSKEDKTEYYYDLFRQHFARLESITTAQLRQHTFTAGLGAIAERLNTTRYDGRKRNDIYYGFVQDEWQPAAGWNIVGGLRYDINTAFASRLSPKLAASYTVNPQWRLRASYGGGFKAPDFRQLFLNFLNTAAGGYVVYGANEINRTELEAQKARGEVSSILPLADKLAKLKAETSEGWNLGVHYDGGKWKGEANLFRNDIDNLIQNHIIAFRSSGAPVYSYFNVRRAFTQGVELNGSFQASPKWTVSAGYQALITADKDELARIRRSEVFGRDLATGNVYALKRGDYAGLPGRSVHTAQLKLLYNDAASGWGGSLRTLYRSRWGTFDATEGNGIINRDDEFAPGYTQINLQLSRQCKALRIAAGADNLLNYRDRINLPSQPGIQPYLMVFYAFAQTPKQKTKTR